jgi:hypothetical protein
MSTKLTTLEDLQDFAKYRLFMKDRLKAWKGERAPVYVTKEPLEFSDRGKPWKGRALLLGDPQSLVLIKALKKAGVMCREGTVALEDDVLVVEGIEAKIVKSADKALQRLKIGARARPQGEPLEAADDAAGAGAPGGGAPGAALDEEEMMPGAAEEEEMLPGAAEEEEMQPGGARDASRGVNAAAEEAADALDEDEDEDEDDDARLRWEELKAAVTQELKTALVKDAALKAVAVPYLARSSEKEKARDWAGAIQVFEALRAKIDESPNAAPTVSAAAYRASRETWGQNIAEVRKDVEKVKRAVEAACAEHKELGDPKGRVQKLDNVVRALDAGLSDALKKAEEAKTPAERAAAFRNVRASLDKVSYALTKDPLVKSVDTNPFVESNLVKKASDALKAVVEALKG